MSNESHTKPADTGSRNSEETKAEVNSLQTTPENVAEHSVDQPVFAAVDLGSNSFHLIIARNVDGTIQSLFQDKLAVRLADGLNKDKLSPEAMQRGLDALAQFAVAIQDMRPKNVRAVATFTLRKAKNRNEFLRAARAVFPFPIEVVSGDEEARLIFQGVAHTTSVEGQRLTIDIGGGSTEFSIGKKFKVIQLSSQPMGCVSYTKRYFSDAELSKKQFSKAGLAVQQRLELLIKRFRNTGWDVVIGCSGTIKATFLYYEAMTGEPASQLKLKHLKRIRKDVVRRGHCDKLEHVDPARRPVFPAGLAILIGIFKALDIDAIQYSDAALREGVLSELGDRERHHDIRERTVDSLIIRYDIDTEQGQRVLATTNQLLKQVVHQLDEQNTSSLETIMRWAAHLHEIGLHINRRGIQRHSAYILKNIEMPGFSQEQQNLLSLLVGSYRKRFDQDQHMNFTQHSAYCVLHMIVILRLSTLLNIRRLDNYLPEIDYQLKGKKVQLHFPQDWLTNNSLVQADLETERDYLQYNDITLSFH